MAFHTSVSLLISAWKEKDVCTQAQVLIIKFSVNVFANHLVKWWTTAEEKNCTQPWDYDMHSMYMASSTSGQDEPNRAMWLAILPERARWSHLACLGLPPVSSKKNFPESHSINPLFSKFVQSRWLDTGMQRRTWPISSHLDPTLGQ